MRCPGQPVKKRVSRTHTHCGNNYKRSSKGHTWFLDGILRKCRNCKKTVKRLSVKEKKE